MHAFADLTRTLEGLEAPDAAGAVSGDVAWQAERDAVLHRHLQAVPPADAAWAVGLLAGRAPRPPLTQARLRQLGPALSGLDDWLFEACCQATGDVAEAIAQALPAAAPGPAPALSQLMADELPRLGGQPADVQRERLQPLLARLDPGGRFVLLKLVAGGWRSPVSALTLQRSLAALAGVAPARMALRLAAWTPAASTDATRWQELMASASADDARLAPAQPKPFTPLQLLTATSGPGQAQAPGRPGAVDLERLGACGDWCVEADRGGLRVQLVRRGGSCWLWSTDDEWLGDRVPEVLAAAAALPDGCVLEGELVPWPAPAVRTARRAVAQGPVRFVASDVLESDGHDRRHEPLLQRRQRLLQLLAAAPALQASTLRELPDWPAVAAWHGRLRGENLQALVLKPCAAAALTLDATGWRWPADALVLDTVLLYVQPAAGGRVSSNLACTLALWNRPPVDAAEAQAVVAAMAARQQPQPGGLQLVPVARAEAELPDDERTQVEREVRAHTLQSFGPVRSLRPTLVLSLAFDGLDRSARHKSGVQLRGARLLGLRPGLALHEAGNLPALRALAGLPADQAPGSPDTDGSLRSS